MTGSRPTARKVARATVHDRACSRLGPDAAARPALSPGLRAARNDSESVRPDRCGIEEALDRTRAIPGTLAREQAVSACHGHAFPSDTPPEKRKPSPRQVSWLAGRHLCLTFPVRGTSDHSRQRLAAHSCGGSFGFALAGFTEFPLSSRSRDRENLDGSPHRSCRYGSQPIERGFDSWRVRHRAVRSCSVTGGSFDRIVLSTSRNIVVHLSRAGC
ncbi:hypothetical protein M2440_001315 [Methylorubrum extorquens]|nr:hypothetical protein [Methylorubrum extorquens]